MPKAKFTIENDLKVFKTACAMSDVELIEVVELGPNMYKAEVSFKHAAQLRDLGQYELKIAAKN